MNKHLLILIGGHLATAPRPQKEAAAAVKAGFQVSIRGTWSNDKLAEEDRELATALGVDFRPVVDLRLKRRGRNWVRLRQRLAKEAFERLGIVTPRVFGTGAPELLKHALQIKADLTMVHSEAGLWVAKKLLALGFRVGVDFEDWFSQDMRPEDRQGRPVDAIQRKERFLLHNAHLTITTTSVMAQAMAEDAKSERIPLVIPNCFPAKKAPSSATLNLDSRDPDALSFYWFSQTIGPGRGLEILAQALKGVRGRWQLHLRGELHQYNDWFEHTFPPSVRDKIVLQPTVPNSRLAAHSASHDIGLALEVPYARNKDLTASNKIFEYLRCGLAVIATATQGQTEVMNACPQAGWGIQPDDAKGLRGLLQRLLDNPNLVTHAKLRAKEAGATTWAWEKHEPRLIHTLIDVANSPMQKTYLQP